MFLFALFFVKRKNDHHVCWGGDCQVEDALLARDQARALEIQSRRELARVLEARKVHKTPLPFSMKIATGNPSKAFSPWGLDRVNLLCFEKICRFFEGLATGRLYQNGLLLAVHQWKLAFFLGKTMVSRTEDKFSSFYFFFRCVVVLTVNVCVFRFKYFRR